MVEKKKSNIEKWREKQKLAKLKKEGKLSETEAKEAEKVVETEKPVTEVVQEIEKINNGQIKCRRCGHVFPKEKAVFVKLFGKDGCPKCGHSIS